MSEYKKLIKDFNMIGGDLTTESKKEINVIVERTISSKIENTDYYNNLSPVDRMTIKNYVGKKINIFDGYIGQNKSDALANGIEIPNRYIMERVIFDRNSQKIKMSNRMLEMIKRQVRNMQEYKLSRVYETKNSYRLVFESEDGNYEISIREI
jgi:hypothetical protein